MDSTKDLNRSPSGSSEERVPADGANEVLVAIGNVLAPQLQPLRTRHGASQACGCEAPPSVRRY